MIIGLNSETIRMTAKKTPVTVIMKKANASVKPSAAGSWSRLGKELFMNYKKRGPKAPFFTP